MVLWEMCAMGDAVDKAEAWDAISEKNAEIQRLRAALAPFAADKLPSPRKTEIAYNRDGLRCAMSPLEIARTAAYAALSPADRGGAE